MKLRCLYYSRKIEFSLKVLFSLWISLMYLEGRTATNSFYFIFHFFIYEFVSYWQSFSNQPQNANCKLIHSSKVIKRRKIQIIEKFHKIILSENSPERMKQFSDTSNINQEQIFDASTQTFIKWKKQRRYVFNQSHPGVSLRFVTYRISQSQMFFKIGVFLKIGLQACNFI